MTSDPALRLDGDLVPARAPACGDGAPADDESFLDEVLDRVVALVQRGERADAGALAAERPHLGSRVLEQVRLAESISPRPRSDLPEVGGYTIIAEAGRGGMGTVYLARQESLGGRPVALKVLSGSSSLSPAARRRFKQESEVVARLRHPNIIGVHDVPHAEPAPAYAMEWVEGRSLAAVIERARGATSGAGGDSRAGISMEQVRDFVAGGEDAARDPGGSGGVLEAETYTVFVCRVGLAMARALAAVHRAGLLHRDVKPSNILVRCDGVPLLTDFGLAEDAEATLATQAGQFLGTPAYAPPEQLRGERLDARSDVYALGATLYHALALRVPFDGSGTGAILRQIESGRLRPVRSLDRRVPRDLETIVTKAMEAEASRRYGTAEEMAEDLERLLSLRPVRARRAGIVGRAWKLARRRKGLVVGSGIAAIAISGAVVAGMVQWWDARAERARHASALRAEAARAAAGRLVADFSAELFAELRTRVDSGANVRDSIAGASAAVQRVGEMVSDPSFGDDPVSQSSFHRTLGDLCYYDLGLNGLAERQYRSALALLEQAGPEHWREVLLLRLQISRAMIMMDLAPAAEAILVRMVEDLRDAGLQDQPAMAQTLQDLASALSKQQRYVEAAGALRQSLAIRRRIGSGPDNELVSTLNSLGDSLRRAGQLDEAETVLSESLRESEAMEANAPGASVVSRRYIARVSLARGDLAECERMQRDVLERSLARWGPHHAETITAWCELGKTTRLAGNVVESERLLRQALEGCHRSARQFPRNEAIVLELLAQTLESAGGREGEVAELRNAARAALLRVEGVKASP